MIVVQNYKLNHSKNINFVVPKFKNHAYHS